MIYFGLLALAVSILALAAFGWIIGHGRIVTAQLRLWPDSLRWQERYNLTCLLGLALIGSLTIYSLMLSFILMGSSTTKDVLEILKQTQTGASHFSGGVSLGACSEKLNGD